MWEWRYLLWSDNYICWDSNNGSDGNEKAVNGVGVGITFNILGCIGIVGVTYYCYNKKRNGIYLGLLENW